MPASRVPASPAPPRVRPPAVDRILAAARPRLGGSIEATALRDAAREVQSRERRRLVEGERARSAEELGDEVVTILVAYGESGSGLEPAINATGVIVHTNLGRAVWPAAALQAAARAAADPVLLELDRGTGRRGPRSRAAEEHLIALTGAEDALVTNNNAAAVALAVGLARRGGVLVSRGELVEIGGGVRIPEIVRRAGARLIEVGTTNRTRASDFEAPLAEGRAALILRVHPSNFRQVGFIEDPDLAALVEVARRHDVPIVDDLGSGALIDTATFGLEHEPTPRERLSAGADLVTFSGDKLVGGPQAGLVVGRAALIERIRRDPLARAVRPDKVTLAAVTATLALYRAGRARTEIPVWQAIGASVDDLRARADSIASRLSDHRAGVTVVETEATIGGGALPGQTLPSVALRVRPRSAARLSERLRLGEPAVVARIESAALVVDLRTVDPRRDDALARALKAALDDTGTAPAR